MLILYYATNTCSLAAHIALEDAGADYELRRIDFTRITLGNDCLNGAEVLVFVFLGDPDDDAPEFTCLEEDPVIVNLTDDERRRIELTV